MTEKSEFHKLQEEWRDDDDKLWICEMIVVVIYIVVLFIWSIEWAIGGV